jgi:hypothetical protein
MVRSSSYASLFLGLRISACLAIHRSCIPLFARRSRWERKKRRVKKQRLCSSCPPGNRRRRNSAMLPGQALRHSGGGPGWAPRVLLSQSNRRSAGAPAAREWRRWCSSTPQNHRPGQLAAHIALGITWGGLGGDRGHRKGQSIACARQPFRAPH